MTMNIVLVSFQILPRHLIQKTMDSVNTKNCLTMVYRLKNEEKLNCEKINQLTQSLTRKHDGTTRISDGTIPFLPSTF